MIGLLGRMGVQASRDDRLGVELRAQHVTDPVAP